MLSIVIPVYNESAYLSLYLNDLLEKLHRKKLTFEIILSQNGSTDNTYHLAKIITKEHPQVKLISSRLPNYGEAVKRGFLKAQGEYLVLFDLDYYDVPFLSRSLPKLKTYDAIIGAKKGINSQDQRHFFRRFVTTGFSLLLKLFFGMKISDTHGIKILKRTKFLPIIHKCRFTREIFDTELLIRAEYEGLSLGEIGVKVIEKRASRTSILKRSLTTIKDLFRLKMTLMQEYGL